MTDYLYGFKPPKTLYEMTWEEVQEVLQVTDLVILPIGSTENHGPHLPLGNDALQVREFARRMSLKLEEMGIKSVVGPLIPFGCASYHMPFPGTIHLQASTFQALMKDVCMSLYRHGFRKFVFPLGHGGNYGSMMVVAQQIVDETEDAQTLVVNWLTVLPQQYPNIIRSKKSEGHGGEPETSRLLAFHPELVEMKRARPHYSEKAARTETHDHPLLGGGIFKPNRSMKNGTPVGSVGDPTLAKAETGEKLLEIMVNWMAEAVKNAFSLEAL